MNVAAHMFAHDSKRTSSATRHRSPRARFFFWARLLIGAVILLALAIIWAFLLSGDFRAFEIIGNSMAPTLERGDRVIAALVEVKDIHRGDIVVVALPGEDEYELVKRVVALPGDTVQLQRGTLYVNQEPQPLPDGAIPYSYGASSPPVKLNGIGYFVLGDNRPVSYDSEEFGPIGPHAIRGKVLLRYWPWKKRRVLP